MIGKRKSAKESDKYKQCKNAEGRLCQRLQHRTVYYSSSGFIHNRCHSVLIQMHNNVFQIQNTSTPRTNRNCQRVYTVFLQKVDFSLKFYFTHFQKKMINAYLDGTVILIKLLPSKSNAAHWPCVGRDKPCARQHSHF